MIGTNMSGPYIGKDKNGNIFQSNKYISSNDAEKAKGAVNKQNKEKEDKKNSTDTKPKREQKKIDEAEKSVKAAQDKVAACQEKENKLKENIAKGEEDLKKLGEASKNATAASKAAAENKNNCDAAYINAKSEADKAQDDLAKAQASGDAEAIQKAQEKCAEAESNLSSAEQSRNSAIESLAEAKKNEQEANNAYFAKDNELNGLNSELDNAKHETATAQLELEKIEKENPVEKALSEDAKGKTNVEQQLSAGPNNAAINTDVENTVTTKYSPNTIDLENNPFDHGRVDAKSKYHSSGEIKAYDPDKTEAATSGLEELEGTTDAKDLIGFPSVMSRVSYVTLNHPGTQEKDRHFDIYGKRKWYEMHDNTFNPTAMNLITDFAGDDDMLTQGGALTYKFSDFAYCKYYGLIPNNRLITLRRFPHPVFDNIKNSPWWDNLGTKESPKYTIHENPKFMPIAQAVTWFGKETGNELKSLTSMKTSLPWDEVKSPDGTNTEESDESSDTTRVGSSFQMISILTGEGDISKGYWNGYKPRDPYAGGPYSNRVQGPVNRVDAVKKRTPGLKFDQSITLKFHYTARSIGNINTKAVMLEILSNFLVMTYGVGAFWGGMHRFNGRVIAYPWKEGLSAWYRGDAIGFIKASKNALVKASSRLEGLLNSLKSDPMGALKNIAGEALNAGFGALVSKLGGSPQQLPQYRSLLNGEPTGEWHLVVGNPYNPIMTIGNLVCTGCSFEFGDVLGPDDFPEELTITVTLEHGMSRDRHAVESMFNRGFGRIYTIPTSIETTSAAQETHVDKYTGAPGQRQNLGSGRRRLRGGEFFDAITSSVSDYWYTAHWTGNRIVKTMDQFEILSTPGKFVDGVGNAVVKGAQAVANIPAAAQQADANYEAQANAEGQYNNIGGTNI